MKNIMKVDIVYAGVLSYRRLCCLSFLALTLLLCACFHAPSISVPLFVLDETDQTANQHGTTVLDQNGGKCALIRIQTTMKGLAFDVDSLGVRKVDDSKYGEVWLYVPAGVKRMSIRHPLIGSLSDYVFPVEINAGSTYRMWIVTEYDSPSILAAQNDYVGVLDVSYEPFDCEVYIDGKPVGSSPGVFKDVPVGVHEVQLRKDGYLTEVDTVTISGGQTTSLSGCLEYIQPEDLASPSKYDKDKVFDIVEQMPSFPGGMKAMNRYLIEHIKCPAMMVKESEQGRVICTFIIERDGTLTDIKVYKSLEPSLDEEVCRAIKSMPRWNPGRSDGQTVRVRYILPVTLW